MSLKNDVEKVKVIYQTLAAIYLATLKTVGADTEGPLLTLIERNGSEAAFNYVALQEAGYTGIKALEYIENTDTTFLIVSYQGESELMSIEKILDPTRRVTDGSSGQATELDFDEYFANKDISDIDEIFIAAGLEHFDFLTPDFIGDVDYDTVDDILNSADV